MAQQTFCLPVMAVQRKPDAWWTCPWIASGVVRNANAV